MLPWFKDKFPIYLAPMAGVTDVTFRTLCKELGADVIGAERGNIVQMCNAFD